jgi:hypothetical protein
MFPKNNHIGYTYVILPDELSKPKPKGKGKPSDETKLEDNLAVDDKKVEPALSKDDPMYGINTYIQEYKKKLKTISKNYSLNAKVNRRLG